MKLPLVRTACAAGALMASLSAMASDGNIEVTFNFNGGSGPTSLYDTYIFAAVFPSVSTNSVANGPYSPTQGQTITVPNPNQYNPGMYSYIFLGLYDDSAGTHVAVGTENDLSGHTWDYWFNGTNGLTYTEPSIISDLKSGNPVETAGMADYILSYYVPVFPVLGYLNGPDQTAKITGFSNGVNIGTATSRQVMTPEPSSLLGLAGLAGICLIRRRK